MSKVKTILVSFFAVLLLVFMIQNAATVEVRFLFWSFSSARVFILVGFMIIGFVIGSLVTNLYHSRANAKRSVAQHVVKTEAADEGAESH